MEKEIKITPPEGFEIDKENSTFECIKLRPIVKGWRGNKGAQIKGYFIHYDSCISDLYFGKNIKANYGVFATQKQAKSALAMARISQIMANDERFGGVVTDEEWKDEKIGKYTIIRDENHITTFFYHTFHQFLAFHTAEQRDLFFQENEDLVRDYFMID